VLVTDGDNEPPTGSPYGDTAGPAWKTLRDRAGKLTGSNRSLRGYALPLGSQANGADLLRTVIADTTKVNAAGVPDISGFLDRTKQAVRVEKAQRSLAGDIGKGVVVAWPSDLAVDADTGRTSAEVTLRSEMATAPVTVANLAVAVDNSPGAIVSVESASPLTLAPGQAETVRIRFYWTPDAGPVPYERKEAYFAILRLNAAVSSPWAAPLARDVALNVPPNLVDNSRTVQMTATVGYWWVLPALGALVLLLVLAAVVRAHLRRNPRVAGTLRLDRLLSPESLAVPLRRGRTAFTFPAADGGPTGRGTVRPIRTENGLPALEITYSPDGSAGRSATRRLEPAGGTLTVASVEFTYVTEDQRAHGDRIAR
jgi:hypothetical protein